jgi:type IV secretory pathway TrbD component
MRIPINESCSKVNLMWGCDRNLLIILTCGCGVGASAMYALESWWGFLFILAVLGVGVYFLKDMGREDPHLFRVFLAYLSYRPFYPAKGGIRGRAKRTRARWPR